MNARVFFWSLTSALAGFLFGFDTVVISGAEKTIQSLCCLTVRAEIRGPHIEAALALWEYVERSCAYIFGNTTGNPDADVILKALQNSSGGADPN